MPGQQLLDYQDGVRHEGKGFNGLLTQVQKAFYAKEGEYNRFSARSLEEIGRGKDHHQAESPLSESDTGTQS